MKKRSQKIVKGWLPNEFASVQQTHADKFPPMVRWTARALVAGTAASAGLLILVDVAGLTQGVGAYLWPVAIAGTVWGAVAAVPFIVKRKASMQGRNRA
jgi:type IV secretory pathway TrbD component